MANPPPLTGITVIELAGLAPAPFAGLLLADAGATVLRIDRPESQSPPAADLLARHKAAIAVDLRRPRGVALVRALAARADVLIDPFRPGVLERLGLGPAPLCAANPRLVYARLSGFRRGRDDESSSSSSSAGRGSRYAAMAGHDINYLAVSGVLSLLGPAGQPPLPPVNLLADFAGGGAALVQGVLLALVARARTGRGQVVAANMVDGSAYVAQFARFHRARRTPAVGDGPRGQNLLDGGCPFYGAYETADGGRYMAVGALEPKFYAELIRGLGLGDQGWEERRNDRECWEEMRRVFTEVFRRKTRAEWERVFDGTDACVTPVLDFDELEGDPEREGDVRPLVALTETPMRTIDEKDRAGTFVEPGEEGLDVLKSWLGWTEGKDFTVQDGGLVLTERSKI